MITEELIRDIGSLGRYLEANGLIAEDQDAIKRICNVMPSDRIVDEKGRLRND